MTELDELAEAREELRVVARQLLGKARPPAAPDWSQLAASGWLGLEVPSDFDGADATFAEVAVIAEELGRAVACGPYLGSAVLGVGALLELAPGPDRDTLLRAAVAGGELPVAVLAADGIPFWLVKAADGLRLHGEVAFVPDAAAASRLLVLARDTEDGTPVIVAVSPDAAGQYAGGVVVEPQPVVDETRLLATVRVDGTPVTAAQIWRFPGDPNAAVQRLLDRAAVAVACDSLGLSEAMLDATVSYVKVREQFGRPVGSFQAVKHACANMLVQVKVARELVQAAVAALAAETAAPDALVSDSRASMAKAYACEAAVQVAGSAMQLHGGIGYTAESGIHLYLKRAALNRALFGSPADHRARIAARYQ